MMGPLQRLAEGLLRPLNPYFSTMLGLLTTVWGVWVVSPFWHTFTSANVYHKALELAPEPLWGAWSILSGLAILWAIFADSVRCLAAAMKMATWHWFTIALFMWWGDWQNTGGLTYTFIAVYSTMVYLNIKVNYIDEGIDHLR